MADQPVGDPRELLRIWGEWEEGQAMPGKVLSDLKRAGLPGLLEGLAAQLVPDDGDDPTA